MIIIHFDQFNNMHDNCCTFNYTAGNRLIILEAMPETGKQS